MVTAIWMAGPALAESGDLPRTLGRPGKDRSSVVVSNPGGAEPGRPATRQARRGGATARPGHVVTNYHARGPLDGHFCLYATTVRREAPVTGAEEFDNQALRAYAAERGMPVCDRGGDAVPTRVASAFVRTIPLPSPRPAIAPHGTAITGLTAYLETNGSLVHDVAATDTPLGAITVEARSAYWVDWGDGTPEEGPFAFEGEPYPSGRIAHQYRDSGSYTVTVRQRWSATWRLGTDSGTVEDLRTEASIPLRVQELQAVIR